MERAELVKAFKKIKMAKRSSGKRSSNRVGQKASAETKLAAALEKAYAMKPGDKMDVIFGRVEKNLGFSQFQIVVSKNKTVKGTPLGVFTKKSCPISPGQFVILEPVQREGQIHSIIARLDKKKDVKALTKAGVIPKDIHEGGAEGSALDDLFDYGEEGEDSEEDGAEEEDEKHEWKSRGKTYVKKKKTAPSGGAAGGGSASGGAVLKEAADAETYAENQVEEDEEGNKKVRRRPRMVTASDAVGGTEAPAPAATTAPEEDEWIDESFLKREAPKSWEDDLDIDNI